MAIDRRGDNGCDGSKYHDNRDKRGYVGSVPCLLSEHGISIEVCEASTPWVFGVVNTTASCILPPILSLNLIPFSPELPKHSSTTGTTTVDGANTTLQPVASQAALPISTPQSSSISSSTSTGKSTSSTKTTSNIYTAVLPAVFGAFILVSCILLLHRYRRRRRQHEGNKTTGGPSVLFKGWQCFSPSPSPSHHALGPDDLLSQRHS